MSGSERAPALSEGGAPGALRGVHLPTRPRERAYRLTGIGSFDALFRAGRRRQGRWIELVVATAQHVPGRVGFVVGRKALARAVDRNRFKRKLREVLRQERPGLAGYDLIVRLKRPAPGAELDAAIQEADDMIRQLHAPAAVE